MRSRIAGLAIVAILLVSNSGCCLLCDIRNDLCRFYWDHHYSGCSQCGECYWSEWFSDPPQCCDPCSRCGRFTGGGHCDECENSHGGHVRLQYRAASLRRYEPTPAEYYEE